TRRAAPSGAECAHRSTSTRYSCYEPPGGMSARATWELPLVSTRIVTERLAMRPPRPNDVPELRRAMRKNDAHLRPWSVAPAAGEDPASLAAVSGAVLRHRREWKRGQAFVLLIVPQEDDHRVIGRVALGGVLRGAFQNAYLGYWLDRDYQGRGLMTEAVRATTFFAFTSARLHRVQAAVMPRNHASLRVLEKLGYRREGLAERYLCIAGKWEDHILLAATAEEWEARGLL
ncbi:MAG: GNAT family N-acetyltransferase, partial [Myxococcota bacterium]|nr:GNAT family N-acetyltransferase [Myxococcota bacterium]